jgi:hypothetical protein
MKSRINPVILENIRNKERWTCDNYANVNIIEQVEYVYVHKENVEKIFMVRKDAFRIVDR